MTINLADNDPRDDYTVADGNSQTVFTMSFEIFDEEDLNVYIDGTLKTLTTDYKVSDSNTDADAGHTSGTTGYVHMEDAVVASGSDKRVVLTRDIELKRTTDFPPSGAFQINSLNTELDKIIAIAADLDDEITRSLRLTDYDTEVSLVLPDVDARKGTVLAFNSSTGAVEAGPKSADVNQLADITTDIATLADIEDGTDATDAIQTVAGISSNVTTVANISSNVTTVAGITANIATVAGDSADIQTVAGDSTDIQSLADITSDIGTVAGISANVTTVAGDSADIQALAAKTTELGLLGTADAIADMNTLATSAIVTDLDLLADVKNDIDSLGDIPADITTVAGISANVTTVAGISANTTTVAGISANVTSVAGISSDVTTVAGQISPTNNIATVAGDSADIQTVAGDSADIATVAGISANVTTVAGISANVTTVAGDTTNIATVAGDSSNIGTVATNIANVNSVGGSIANVNTVASNLADVNSFADTYFISATEPSSPTVGDLWFDTTNNIMKVYGSGGFVNAGSSVNGTANRETFAVGTSEGSYDGSTTVFPIEYDAGYIDVYLNGIKLDPDNDFTATNGTSVTLSSAAATGDIVDMVGYGTFELTDFSVGAANNVDLTGLADDQILRYNSTSGNFEAEDLPTGIPDQSTHSGKFLTTDGSSASWATVTQATGNELENLSEDTTPQLGGNLDAQTNNITNVGDLGVGTSSPDKTVHISKANSEFRIDNAGAEEYTIGTGTVDGAIFHTYYDRGGSTYVDNISRATTHQWRGSDGNEDMRINSSGNVGIGTASPSSDAIVKFLHINDGTSAGLVLDGPEKFSIYSSSSSALVFRNEDTDTSPLVIYDNDRIGYKSEGSNNIQSQTDMRQGAAKQWGNWEGIGSYSTQDSYNTSSLADIGVALTRVTINNDMNNSGYCQNPGGSDGPNTGNFGRGMTVRTNYKYADRYDVVTTNLWEATGADQDNCSSSILGDLA